MLMFMLYIYIHIYIFYMHYIIYINIYSNIYSPHVSCLFWMVFLPGYPKLLPSWRRLPIECACAAEVFGPHEAGRNNQLEKTLKITILNR